MGCLITLVCYPSAETRPWASILSFVSFTPFLPPFFREKQPLFSLTRSGNTRARIRDSTAPLARLCCIFYSAHKSTTKNGIFCKSSYLSSLLPAHYRILIVFGYIDTRRVLRERRSINSSPILLTNRTLSFSWMIIHVMDGEFSSPPSPFSSRGNGSTEIITRFDVTFRASWKR